MNTMTKKEPAKEFKALPQDVLDLLLTHLVCARDDHYPALEETAMFLKSVELLLSLGADPNKGYIVDYEARHPISEATNNKYVETVKLLLKYGADCNKPEIYCENRSISDYPLTLAIINNDIELTRMLLEYGADPLLKTTCDKKCGIDYSRLRRSQDSKEYNRLKNNKKTEKNWLKLFLESLETRTEILDILEQHIKNNEET